LVDNNEDSVETLFENLDTIEFQHNIIDSNYTRLWANKGHSFGEGLISPDRNFLLFKIPKNASTFLVDNLTKLDWEHVNFEDYLESKVKTIVILRDPISRWISGVVEYLFLYHKNILDNIIDPFTFDYLPLLGEKLAISLIFEKIVFDDHTDRQCSFLQKVDIDNTVWFRFDNNLNKNISCFLNSAGINNDLLDAAKVNSSEGNDSISMHKRKLKELFEYIISKDQFKRNTLEQWLWCDIELYNKVKFYEAR
jgi:hypothetical protein